jgi:pyruvate ferredoxin oxidoreductase alpha subunit
MRSLHTLFRMAEKDDIDAITFLDLNREVVDKQLARELRTRRSGPIAENLLRDVGAQFGGIAAKMI